MMRLILLGAALSLAMLPAQAQGPSDVPEAVLLALSDGDAEAWEEAEDALDDGLWQEAASRYGALADRGVQSDAARFWQAYAQFRAQRYDAAQASLERLRTEHPQSAWLKDARELEAEIGGALQGPVAAAAEADPELKLFAVQSLLRSDPDAAVQILADMLDGDATVEVKRRALFLITQAPSSDAWPLLAGSARGERGPELQRAAVRIIGSAGEEEGLDLLESIYADADDPDLKGIILRSFAAAGDARRLADIARSDASPEARIKAIQMLGVAGAPDMVRELMEDSDDPAVLRAGLRALGIAGDVEGLSAIAQEADDPEVVGGAIRGLGMAGGRRAEWALVQLYRKRTEPEVRREVLRALGMQGYAEAIIDLLRQESNPELRRVATGMLSQMDAPAAREYMRELAAGNQS